jgi:hypothetical protein
VLLALERLKRSFGQIFIISHVGEVQESALVDEVWMVEEDEQGKSLVRRMDARRGGGGPRSRGARRLKRDGHRRRKQRPAVRVAGLYHGRWISAARPSKR